MDRCGAASCTLAMHKDTHTPVTDRSDASALRPLVSASQSPPPWWAPHTQTIRKVIEASERQPVADALNAAASRDVSVRFVQQSQMPAAEPYEAYIHRTRCVPTRDNAHDLFNGVMWLGYPRTKRCLNELQAQELERFGSRATRGALRDALTVFDENAAILWA